MNLNFVEPKLIGYEKSLTKDFADTVREFLPKKGVRLTHGWLHTKLGSNKTFNCQECGLSIDRDVNGARNICLKNI